MKIDEHLTDGAVLSEVGRRLQRLRLQRGEFTQEGLAKEAGVSTATVGRIEAGHSAQLTSLIRILRVLGMTGALEGLVPDSGPSPIERLERERGQRQRVRPTSSGPDRSTGARWTWGDDEGG